MGLVLLPTSLAALVIGWSAVGGVNFGHPGVSPSFSMTVAALVGLAIMGAALSNREVAIVVVVAMIYLNLSDVLIRFYGVPSSLQVLLLPVLLMVWIARRPWDLWRTVEQPLTWAIAAFLATVLLSSTYALKPELADARFLDSLRTLGLFALVVLLVNSGQRLRMAVWAALLCGAFLASLGLWQIVGGDFESPLPGFARVQYAHIHGDVFEARISGPVGDPNFFAQVLLLLVPLGLSLVWGEQRLSLKLLALTSVGAVVAACILTYSRGGALALGIVVVLSLLTLGLTWQRVASGLLPLFVGALLFVPSDFVGRLATIEQLFQSADDTEFHDSSVNERRLVAAAAWEMFKDHPVLGVGAGNYSAHYTEYSGRVGSAAMDYREPGVIRHPHNLYLELAAERGLLGLGMFFALIGVAFHSLSRSRQGYLGSGEVSLAHMARSLQIALIGYVVTSVFLHWAFERYLWLLLALAAALVPVGHRPWFLARPDAGAGADAPPPRALSGGAAASRDGSNGADAPAEVAAEPTSADGVAASEGDSVRRGIAVLLSRFPTVTETFILREIDEMERQGQPVTLVPLLREYPPVLHPEAQRWVERALYTPFLSLRILAANGRALGGRPWAYLSLLGRLILGSITEPRFLLGTLAIVPKSVYIAEQLRKGGIRHVHAHFATHPATAALIISRFAETSFSFTIHAHDLLSKHHRPLLGLKIEEARFIRVISAYNEGFLHTLYAGTPREKVHVIHVGIEPELYGAEGAPAPDGAPPELRILTIAGFRPYKGLPVLVEACRMLRDEGFSFRCEVIGDGPMRREIEDLVRQHDLGDRLHLLGARPQGEVREILRTRPLFVLPSVILPDGWMEGIPVALMEAMAAESPVIASRLSGIPELVEDGVGGLLVEPGDAAELAAAIRRVAADPELARSLGGNGRRRVDEAFRLDATVSELLALIDRHNDPVSHAVVAETARRLRALSPTGQVGVRRVQTGVDSEVARLLVPGPDRFDEWVLKRHLGHPADPRPASERARHEFHVLSVLSERLPAVAAELSGDGRRLGVPRPIHLDAEAGVVVMEACHGESLVSILRSARARGPEALDDLAGVLADTGRWLRAMQRATAESVDSETVITTWRAEAHGDLERCRPLLHTALHERAAQRLVGAFDETATPRLIPVWYHGDLWPGNIFASARRLEVLDMEGVRPGSAYDDVAYFLIQLEGYFDYPLVRRRFGPLRDAFLSAYLDGEPIDPAGYRLSRIAKALQILARTGGRRPRRRLVRLLDGLTV
jgi:colanic acid/amylovoran biosynthesis glycosyltransferase